MTRSWLLLLPLLLLQQLLASAVCASTPAAASVSASFLDADADDIDDARAFAAFSQVDFANAADDDDGASSFLDADARPQLEQRRFLSLGGIAGAATGAVGGLLPGGGGGGKGSKGRPPDKILINEYLDPAGDLRGGVEG